MGFKLKVKSGVGRISERGIMKGVKAKKRKLSLVTVFALIEIIIIFTDIGKSVRVERDGKKQDATNRGRQLCRVNGEP